MTTNNTNMTTETNKSDEINKVHPTDGDMTTNEIVTILDDVFTIPGIGYSKRWESLSIEEKLGVLAEKLDEVIVAVNKMNKLV